eukprot:2297829-Amphidinium_carterae.1
MAHTSCHILAHNAAYQKNPHANEVLAVSPSQAARPKYGRELAIDAMKLHTHTVNHVKTLQRRPSN